MTKSDRSYESDLAVFVSLVEQEQDNLWAQADLAAAMVGKYGRKTTQMIATDVGFSASYVRQLVATSVAFPEPEKRAKDLSFSHHRIAAMTENPEQWIDLASQNALSVAELKEAIKATKDKISEAEQARRAAERIVQSAKKFNDRWASIAGQRVVVTFDALEARRSA